MKELRKRGMTPTSLLEETKRSKYGLDNETNLKEEDIGFSNRNAVSTELDKSLSNQRERSMELNSEGLEVQIFSFYFNSIRLPQSFHWRYLESVYPDTGSEAWNQCLFYMLSML